MKAIEKKPCNNCKSREWGACYHAEYGKCKHAEPEKKLSMKIKLILLIVAVALTSCATTENVRPFAPDHKYGKLPVKRNKPVKQKTSWTYRQWNHQGS